MEFLEQFLGPLRSLGMDPLAYPLAVPMALCLRFARASLPWFNSGWMYAVTLVAGGLIGTEAWVVKDALPSLALVHCMTFVALTLSVQRITQLLAEKNDWPWLPKDNAFVKESSNG